ncbi:MAG TPA: xanthine dehydrogenase family protein molybdopterin-binding subunit [Thermoanaerobaculia bacterium]|nr:xanthine dehydrogenase family protein molybdopterin-binding subunit [Thermoanaerobaculia bacterium]
MKEKIRVGFEGDFQVKEIDVAAGDPAPWDPSHQFTIVGTRVPRLDGKAKSTGEAKYSIDVRLPGMLYARILRCPLAAAAVESLDLTAARQSPGVRAVLAIAQPGEKLRFAGQEVAAVAAATPEQADDALAAIRVAYEPRPFVVGLDAARESGAPLVFEGKAETTTSGGEVETRAGNLARNGNVLGPRSSSRGDVEAGFKKADAVVEATYATQVQTHSALETHGLVARWDGEELTVWASTQGIFDMRDQLAEALQMPVSKVRVITEYMGGGFGAKFGPRVEGLAAARLAKEAGAPVKLFLDRKEEQLATGNRPSAVQTIRIGATKDGKLTALQLTVYGNGGTNGGTGTSGPVKNVYACENLKVDEYDVFTNAGPSTAMRAPGHPQGAFALEAAMDELAHAIGMDPLEFRLKNDPSAVRREQFRQGAEKIGWKTRDARRQTSDPEIVRGVGVGAAVWYNTGDPGPRATVTIHKDGSAEVEHGAQDLGTGSRTMIAIVAAEELGLPLEKVSVSIGDSRLPYAPDSGGSTMTPSSAPTIRRAAYQARLSLGRAIAREWKVPENSVKIEKGRVFVPGDPKRDLAWADACKLLPSPGVAATAERADNHDDAWKRFTTGAQFAEVEVDRATGKVRVDRIVAVHDCGVPINRLATESQIQGGVIQGVSYALFEDRILDVATGRMVNPNVESYKIAGALDVPEIDVMLVSVWDGVNNTNSVGIGEPSTVPTAAAIANAVSHALGVQIREIPITPAVVLAAVAAGERRVAGAGHAQRGPGLREEDVEPADARGGRS